MRLYNTLTRRKEEFVPVREGKVSFYICGPTVYNYIHIGNARTFLSFDVIRRYLEFKGYEVTYVQNITDVDDKIINRANEEGKTAAEIAKRYTEAFIANMRTIGVEDPTIRPKATEEISEMIALIERLIAGQHAYEVDGDVYFAVRSFADYGKLSRRNVDDMRSGSRVEVDVRKRDPLDFALWKAAKPGEPSWRSPWGEGRPGWHIECSAMSAKYLGNPFDIHAGGEDLVFPHHENEIAQSEACANTSFANYWLHGGMLTIDKEKMAKSTGNYLLLSEVLKHVSAPVLRLFMLQSHYRSPLDYSVDRLNEASVSLERIETAVRNLNWAVQSIADVPIAVNSIGDRSTSWTSDLLARIAASRERFIEVMDDDFNTAGAVAQVFELVSAANSSIKDGILSQEHKQAVQEAAATIVELLGILGVEIDDGSTDKLVYPEEFIVLAKRLVGYVGNSPAQAVELLLEHRQQARKDKDWALSDGIRDGLAELGYTIEDTPQGMRMIAREQQ